MKALYVLLVATAVLLPMHAIAQDQPPNQGWSFSVGVGPLVTPAYLGDDDYQVLALPIFTANYSDIFFISILDGVGYNLINNDHWRVGFAGKYVFDRQDDGTRQLLVSGDKTNDLKGLGDVDATVELGGFVEYTFHSITVKVEIRQGIGGHEGLVGEAKVEYRGDTTISQRPLYYSIGPEIKYTDESYHETYFGVDATQSAASGLSPYSADAGVLSYGVSGSAVLMLTERISTTLFASYSRLGDEAANSSLVKERGSEHQGIVGLFIGYNF